MRIGSIIILYTCIGLTVKPFHSQAQKVHSPNLWEVYKWGSENWQYYHLSHVSKPWNVLLLGHCHLRASSHKQAHILGTDRFSPVLLVLAGLTNISWERWFQPRFALLAFQTLNQSLEKEAIMITATVQTKTTADNNTLWQGVLSHIQVHGIFYLLYECLVHFHR